MQTLVLVVLSVWIFAESSVNGALNISFTGSNAPDSTTYTLQCDIPGFSGIAGWSRAGSPMTSCLPSGCFTTSSPPYTFRHDSSTIYVDFSILAESEVGIQWTCEHVGDTSVNFNVQIITSTIIAVIILIGSIKILIISESCKGGGTTIVYAALVLARYVKRKNLVHVKCIYSTVGEKVKINCSHPFTKITSDSNIVTEYENEKPSFNIQAVTETHYGVHKFLIPIENSGIIKDVSFETEVIEKNLLKNPLPHGSGREIRMEFHFEVNHEEIHAFRKPGRYIFTDKYNIRGVTFMGIQIIVVAVIFQLISIIIAVVSLIALYYAYGKYDTNVVIPVSCAFAVLFASIGTGLYILTVTCCRQQKDTKKKKKRVDEDPSRCCKTVLLFIAIIFQAAWLLLFVIWIVNKCRQSSADRKDNESIVLQSSDDNQDNKTIVSQSSDDKQDKKTTVFQSSDDKQDKKTTVFQSSDDKQDTKTTVFQSSDDKQDKKTTVFQTTEKRCSTNSIMPEKHSDGDFLNKVPQGRRLPPLTNKDGTDEKKENENENTKAKKQSKKEKRKKEISILQANTPMESSNHLEKRETDSNIEQVNSDASHIDDV